MHTPVTLRRAAAGTSAAAPDALHAWRPSLTSILIIITIYYFYYYLLLIFIIIYCYALQQGASPLRGCSPPCGSSPRFGSWWRPASAGGYESDASSVAGAARGAAALAASEG